MLGQHSAFVGRCAPDKFWGVERRRAGQALKLREARSPRVRTLPGSGDARPPLIQRDLHPAFCVRDPLRIAPR